MTSQEFEKMISGELLKRAGRHNEEALANLLADTKQARELAIRADELYQACSVVKGCFKKLSEES